MAHLQAAAVKKINEICDRYANEKTPLMMILSDIQKEYGYIPLEVQEIVSARTGISVAEIYGVVTLPPRANTSLAYVWVRRATLRAHSRCWINSPNCSASNLAKRRRTDCLPWTLCVVSARAVSPLPLPSTAKFTRN